MVVDEVDQVFELGSMQEVEALFKGMLRDRQLMFFSATLPAPLQNVIDRWMNDPAYVRVNPAQRTSEMLEHLYFVCEERDKIDTLRRLVRLYNPKAAIVFINETDNIGEAVAKLQYVACPWKVCTAKRPNRTGPMSCRRFGRANSSCCWLPTSPHAVWICRR